MNINATFEKLSAMRLNGFESAYRQLIDNTQQEKFITDEFISHLTDNEHEDKYNKKKT